MMDRTQLFLAWRRYYLNKASQGVDLDRLLRGRITHLERRMRKLGAFPHTLWKGIVKRRLASALGMSLGVHKQLLGGLTFSSRGDYDSREEGGLGYEFKPRRGYIQGRLTDRLRRVQ